MDLPGDLLSFTFPVMELANVTIDLDGVALGGLDTLSTLRLLNPDNGSYPVPYALFSEIAIGEITAGLNASVGIETSLGSTTLNGLELGVKIQEIATSKLPPPPPVHSATSAAYSKRPLTPA